ncbi:hypothetical protein NQZ68_032598 [Dissostichus eleginoides]|nr:hypothetical protein NQZ68_032598 [Dissostichus eleginoides]
MKSSMNVTKASLENTSFGGNSIALRVNPRPVSQLSPHSVKQLGTLQCSSFQG